MRLLIIVHRSLIVAFTVTPTVSAAQFAPCDAPSRDYQEAACRIAVQQRNDDNLAVSSARSIFLTHGHRTQWVVILLHGFGNSPQEFNGIAASLYARGINVWIPRLPYHADRRGARMLDRLTATDLRTSAESAADIGDGLGDSVAVMGFSMGGVAAAWIGQHRSDVNRVVLVSPAFALARVPELFRNPLMNAMLLLPNITRGLVRDSPREDRELGWSTHAIAQIFRLGVAVERDADRAPPAVPDIRVLLNAHDQTINATVATKVAMRWAASGADVRTYLLPDSLRLPHDMIDQTEPGGRTALVHPLLEALVTNSQLPGWAQGLLVQPKPCK